ncbi:MAG: MFS transporter [Aestuariivita sp.]|nr:MFS transporter [Aestuariivita sp.]MCY4348156.1 MFS transporter [Aestuariivita sp.]
MHDDSVTTRKRIWGWYFFDWASQPYSTLLLTFIFGPYFAQTAANSLMTSGLSEAAAEAQAQVWWGYGLTLSGVTIAILAPLLGSVADGAARRRPWIWGFSALYVIGSTGIWWSSPETFFPILVLVFFGIGLVGMEMATVFTNAFLPSLAPKPELGRISGTGWALGYAGGILSLIIVLGFFQVASDGQTILGLNPLFGLDDQSGADTRIVGPFSAVWFVVFMIPFYLWVKEGKPSHRESYSMTDGIAGLWKTVRSLPQNRSYMAYLFASMFYRDGLNGLYTFGGIYAAGVMGWTILEIGLFGIGAALSGAVFCWIGGYIDRAIGPKLVIIGCCTVLILVSVLIVMLTPSSVFGISLLPESTLPDRLFFLAGIVIGAAGGVLQSSSRHMLTRQCERDRLVEGFGLYAMSGKATTFLAPLLIAILTDATQSQRFGILPLIFLFAIGLILLSWVRPDISPEK